MFDSGQSGQRASSAQLVDHQLRLQGKWLITTAKSVHNELMSLEGIANGDLPIESFDCTALESIDLAGIQLLIATRKSLHRTNAAGIHWDANTHEWLSLCDLVSPSASPAAC